MSFGDKDNLKGTIADLVAAEDVNQTEKNDFFQSDANAQDDNISALHDSDKAPIVELLRDSNMLVPGSNLGPDFSNEYRRIKRPILSNASGKTASLVNRGNLILITSAVPGEGKTHTAINLALSIAQERDHTVLLVDCDVTRKGVSHMLGVAERSGLVEVLENESLTIGDVLLRTDIPHLSLLSAGKQHEYVTELLASQRMYALVDEIVSRYEDRVIIFDGPPLLSTPQTAVLAGLVGQIVLVIEAGKTPQSVVEEALELIPEEKAAGLVLNKCESVTGRSGYNYGYYGSDQDDRNEST